MNQSTWIEGMAILSASMPNLKAEKPTLDIWRRLLDDLSDDQFIQGVESLCQEEEIYPSTNIVAAIRKYALGNGKDESRARALLAWQAVKKALRHVGTYESVQFDDPVIHSCIIELGGWTELGLIPLDELVWAEKKFMEVYPIFKESLKSHPDRLIGITERANQSFPEYIPPTRFIETGIEEMVPRVVEENEKKMIGP
jgi:hypothetical protein